MSDVDVCNRALALAGARATITSLSDGSTEANNCNLIFTKTRDQVLSMAPWNFVRKTAPLNLIKAQPGTPESTVQNAAQWSPIYPPPQWLYEYIYPEDCLFLRFLTPQIGPMFQGTPIFSTQQYTYFPNGARPMVFTPAQDQVFPWGQIIGITQTNPAQISVTNHGFSNGNTIWITGVIGMTEINNLAYPITVTSANTFTIPINATTFQAYISGGTAVNQSGALSTSRTVLTSAPGALATYNKRETDTDLWSEDALQALVNILASFLVIPLGGDKKLKQMALEEANMILLAARAGDANESLVFQETIPDWIRVRDTYTFDDAPYYAPWPALFTHGLV